MKALIAEDDTISRIMLQGMLSDWGYDVMAVADGGQAWECLQRDDAPKMAILDWEMPGMSGIEVCRKVREKTSLEPAYLILLTSRGAKDDIVAGLQSGANDYLSKPFDRNELQARIQVGRTVVTVQQDLAAQVRKLEAALAEVKQLRGLLPICSYCKKIRDDQNYWQNVDAYIGQYTDIRFSHGICPTCWENVVKPQLQKDKGKEY